MASGQIPRRASTNSNSSSIVVDDSGSGDESTESAASSDLSDCLNSCQEHCSSSARKRVPFPAPNEGSKDYSVGGDISEQGNEIEKNLLLFLKDNLHTIEDILMNNNKSDITDTFLQISTDENQLGDSKMSETTRSSEAAKPEVKGVQNNDKRFVSGGVDVSRQIFYSNSTCSQGASSLEHQSLFPNSKLTSSGIPSVGQLIKISQMDFYTKDSFYAGEIKYTSSDTNGGELPCSSSNKIAFVNSSAVQIPDGTRVTSIKGSDVQRSIPIGIVVKSSDKSNESEDRVTVGNNWKSNIQPPTSFTKTNDKIQQVMTLCKIKIDDDSPENDAEFSPQPQRIEETLPLSLALDSNPVSSQKLSLIKGLMQKMSCFPACLANRRFFCDFCSKGYKKKSHLERHLRVHTGERPYSCRFCTKRFSVRSVLKQHERIHTGEKPYSCKTCGNKFPQKSGLMTHEMLHTGKPFECDICDKSFVSNHKLISHQRSHEGIVRFCAKCKMYFFTEGAEKQHKSMCGSI